MARRQAPANGRGAGDSQSALRMVDSRKKGAQSRFAQGLDGTDRWETTVAPMLRVATKGLVNRHEGENARASVW